jgi:hypothetical protein
MNGNVINNKLRVIFQASELTKIGEIPKIMAFTKFDLRRVRGTFSLNANGKPILKGDTDLRPGLKRDDKNQIVNRLGYLCDTKGNIVD